jgi:GxxExxY protein
MKDIVYAAECYRFIGACFEVYKDKGSGFLEAVFQECLELELGLQGIPYTAQAPLSLTYKGQPLKQKYVADFIGYNKIVIELKAVEKLTDDHRAQLLNYLHATGHRLGLLVNFGHHPNLEWERLVL